MQEGTPGKEALMWKINPPEMHEEDTGNKREHTEMLTQHSKKNNLLFI